MPLAARRSFRLALATSLALAAGYGLGLGIPFFPALFTVLLGAAPAPPPGPRQLPALVLVLCLTLGIGVLLGPLLQRAPLSALLLITLGLYGSSYLGIMRGKAIPSLLLGFGFCVIPAASSVSQALASGVIAAMVVGAIAAVLCLWLVYPLFPEDPGPAPAPPAPAPVARGHWLSLRATLIVLPTFLLALTNPAAYLPVTVKSLLLGREATEVNLRGATRELIGSTALGGVFAIAVWTCLGLAVELWFFTGWVLLAALFIASGAYGVLRSRLAPSFWVNTLSTLLILLGSAVQDSTNGKDVYTAFAVRLALFLAVAVYAVVAVAVLEQCRTRRLTRRAEAIPC
jgi:Protein of unknown function (DUF2955)